MAQTLPKMVKAKSGAQYDVNSPQGQMIVNAAKPAFNSDSKILATISTNVISIGESVATMVMIAQADARGEALNKSNVVQDDLGGAPSELTSGQMRDRGEGGGDDGGLGGLMGIGAMVGGFGKGLSFWGTPLAIAGALTFVTFIGGLIGVAYVGAKVFNSSADEIAEGMETLSNADVDTDKVIQLGKALAIFGGALAAEGVGAGIGSIGSLVSGVVDGLSGFLGLEKRDPMAELKEFAKHDISEAEVIKIERNSRALLAFSTAMGASKIGAGLGSVATLIGGVADGIGAMFGLEKYDPMEGLVEFAEHEISEAQVKQIEVNSRALLAFSGVMVGAKGLKIVEGAADLVIGAVGAITGLFPDQGDPMDDVVDFARNYKLTEDEVTQIGINARGLLLFSGTMAVAKPLEAVGAITDIVTNVANSINKFFGLFGVSADKDPMIKVKKFAETKLTETEASQIELNAKSLVSFSKAMAAYGAGGATKESLNLIGNMAEGIVNFFGGTTGIDYDEIRTFAASDIGTLEPKITANALALSSFATAMSAMSSDKTALEFKNIGTNILAAVGSFFGGDANASMMKNITAIEEFTETTLDLAKVENNISAIEKFMAFGQSMIGLKGGDLSGVSDFAEAMVSSAHGIKYALHGGDDKYGVPGFMNDIKIKPGQGLASVGIMEMTDASLGVAVLRHALTNNAPLQELRAVSAEMNTSSGAVTIIAPADNSIKTNTSTTHLIDLEAAARQSAIDAFMLQQSAQ
jgi:hypothetical protein